MPNFVIKSEISCELQATTADPSLSEQPAHVRLPQVSRLPVMLEQLQLERRAGQLTSSQSAVSMQLHA